MADEVTQTDTETSTTEAPTSEAAAVETATETTETETADETETSVLGGEADEAEEETETQEAEGPPDAYDLKLTDKDGNAVDLDKDALEAAEPVFRELGLSNDQANKLMPIANDFAQRTAEATLAKIVEAGAQQKKDWFDAFKADPEIGGAKAEETEHLAAKGLDALGFAKDHPFRKALTETGFGNHPDMIRAFRKVGEMVGEDGFVRGGAGGSQKVERLEALYPDDVPKT